jgi:hypothetical protein
MEIMIGQRVVPRWWEIVLKKQVLVLGYYLDMVRMKLLGNDIPQDTRAFPTKKTYYIATNRD